MSPPVTYTYRALVEKVVDGDTLYLAIDLGFRNTRHERVRLARINAPEMSTPEGRAAQMHAAGWLRYHGPNFVIASSKLTSTLKQDNYGRYLVEIWPEDSQDESLNQWMLDHGYAALYEELDFPADPYRLVQRG